MHQHIVEDQEFIFELEINDLNQSQKTMLNNKYNKDLQNKISNKHNLQTVKEQENIISESVSQTEFSSEKTDSKGFKKFLQNQQINQDLKRNSQINLYDKTISIQNPNKLIQQNYCMDNINNQFLKSTNQVIVQQPLIPKEEYNKDYDKSNLTQIDETIKHLKSQEKIVEEDFYNFKQLSQIASYGNLLSQQELELVYYAQKHLKSDENLHLQDNTINQLNFQKNQQVTSLNNINMPLSAQFPSQDNQEQLKSFNQTYLSNNESFQLIELFQKMKESQSIKNKRNSQAQKQNKFQYKTQQTINRNSKIKTPSRPTDTTDKQEKEMIKLDKQNKRENILVEGSSTTSKSSNKQNLIIDQIIHKKSIKSNNKISFFLLFNILPFICIFVAYQAQMESQLNSLKDSLNTSQKRSLLGQYYDQQALTQLIKYEYNLNILPKDLESAITTFDQVYCQQIRSNFQTQLQQNINSIIQLSQSQNKMQIYIFSQKQAFFY
ncbi:transmembrane protein, putative (macronuclear) [Tetrahymena thermophila SB210]|uniref:Transmembrane protein, putative n=1 Tax=Tetrahymena thermophila (strain SB210) TaxID=312017 RepID=Q22P99_TETTS|nr:transmembrane protein, putative [Tetrahymena thermophila SB210]EAR87210.2 transmembrane protein, putative [Tetrahymena thermophila SB210]|eukprot:XP_001007455.2 transmembrane protein, putative [Tetrahymena thermophila SB210]